MLRQGQALVLPVHDLFWWRPDKLEESEIDATNDETDLVRAAQAGDAGSLGVLLARHEAGMRARLTVLENSGHFGHLEEPAEFARAMLGIGSAAS
jgi:hypothetical protein